MITNPFLSVEETMVLSAMWMIFEGDLIRLIAIVGCQ